jgi:protein required for attachment to host cells
LIIVADGGRARLFVSDAGGGAQPGPSLVERESLVNADYRAHGADSPGRTKSERVTNRQAGDVHPVDARRDQHRLELERRFAREIAQHAAALTLSWPDGHIVLVAEPRMLGLLRDPLHKALKPGVELKELAKDYSHLTASELRDQLALHRLII